MPVSTERADLLGLLFPLVRALRRIEDDAAAEHGLTMWKYAVLSAVSATSGLNQRQLATVLQYSANRIIGDLDDLEQRGFVERVAGPDRRSNTIRITRAGTGVRRQIQRRIHDAEDELLAVLPVARRRDLRLAVERLGTQLRPDPS